MFEIEMQEISQDFFPIWKAAGVHLNKQVERGIQFWLRAHPNPPFLEHFSFRLGNQLFFIQVEDVEKQIQGPGSRRGLVEVASNANGHACILPMRRKLLEGTWVADRPGWGLVDAKTQTVVDPFALVTEEKIEMTQWEKHDMSVQIVRDYLIEQGFELISWQGNPKVDPAIWFIGDTQKPECVIVRSGQFPATEADKPDNWLALVSQFSQHSPNGHFASVTLASADQPFDSIEEPVVPLWRGNAMHVRFTGLN